LHESYTFDYIFLIREALDLPGITTMKKFVKSKP